MGSVVARPNAPTKFAHRALDLPHFEADLRPSLTEQASAPTIQPVTHLFEKLPDRVSIYEVSPRDGLQNERVNAPLPDKLRLIEALAMAGLTRIEITSFVSPKWIPQLADADEVAKNVKPHPGVRYSALCPNIRGLERAMAAHIEEIAVFLSASETHNQKNTNKSVDESLAEFEETVARARSQTPEIRVRGYVSTVWGCPYEGTVDLNKSMAIAKRLIQMGCYQISLGDTIGVGTPRQTKDIVLAMLSEFSPNQIALHMHDTRGTALANILVGLELGIRDFDSSVGGLGGCPYAPGAAGNVATEDLVYMLHGMGIETGIDLERIVEAGKAAASIVGRALPGKVHQSGVRSLRA
jgi:hydroxymethylglutaryl-CoA lyase